MVPSSWEGEAYNTAPDSVTRLVLCTIVVAFTAGCRASADPPRFSGHEGGAPVDPKTVTDLALKPSGFTILGSVSARCRADEGVRSIRHTSLADVDCSEDLLIGSLREKAGAIGGHALVWRECRRDSERPHDAWKSTSIQCTAKVAANPNAPRAEPAPLVASLEYESPSQAFGVTVGYAPASATAVARAPRSPDRVNELAVPSPSHVLMGDIMARCRDGCERAAVRYAVRAVAARVGATDVVGVTCTGSKQGILCTGRAVRPEADPETNVLAR